METVKIHRVKQTSEEWHRLRSREGLCLASQAAAVMNEGKFTPKNQDELLLLKRGELQITPNKAMAHGNKFEAEAREWAEEWLGELFEPMSIEREYKGLNLWASLDGISLGGDVFVEIKCPLKGMDSELWKYTVRHKKPPAHYCWQMTQQSMVSESLGFFVVYDASQKRGIALKFENHYEDGVKLLEGWREFWQRYHRGDIPEPKYMDMQGSDEWKQAAHRYREARARLVAAREEEGKAKEELLALARENSASGHGIKATRYFRAGNVDYRKIPELAGVDLNDYRKDGSWCWRIDEE